MFKLTTPKSLKLGCQQILHGCLDLIAVFSRDPLPLESEPVTGRLCTDFDGNGNQSFGDTGFLVYATGPTQEVSPASLIVLEAIALRSKHLCCLRSLG